MGLVEHHLSDINDHDAVYSILANIMAQRSTGPAGENTVAMIGLVIYNELRELNTTLRRIEDSLARATEDPPCEHWDAQIGTVTAGDLHSGPHCGTATCAECVEKSRGYCTMITGLPCSELLTYEEARKQRS